MRINQFELVDSDSDTHQEPYSLKRIEFGLNRIECERLIRIKGLIRIQSGLKR